MPRISEQTIVEHRHRIEAALLDAWDVLRREHGFEEITLALVAERAGIARNSIYRYFPDKMHLMLAYLRREVARFIEDARAQVDQVAGADARLRLLIELLMAHFATHAGAGPTVDVSPLLSPELRVEFLRSFEPFQALLLRLVREGVHEGVFRELDPETAATLIHAAIGAYRVPVASGAIPADEAARITVDFILHGLADR